MISTGAARTLTVYFLLAAFDLATVAISLSLNHRIMRIYSESVIVNRNWADRQGIYANLGSLAAEVNAPGNDVFQSMDIDGESRRLDDQLKEFEIRVEEARRDLRHEIPAEDSGPLLDLLDRAESEMELDAEAARVVFALLRQGNMREAGEEMARMDRRYNRARELLSELDARVRLLQRRNLDDQAQAAEALRQFEFLIGGLMVFMILGVTVYGHYLVRQAQRNSKLREQYVKTIAENEARLEAVFRTASEGILTVRDGVRIESANPAAGGIFGCDPAALQGRDIATLLDSSNWPLKTPCSELETLARRETGAEFPLELSVSEHVDLPDGALTTWIVRDISDRKHIESELTQYREHLERLVRERTAELEASNEQLRTAERLASIGTLAAGLGHDVKNLLFPMRCRLDLLERLDLTDKAREETAELRSSLDYLQQLSNGLRLLSLDPEDADASTEYTNINEWWNEVGGLLIRSLPTGVAFHASLPEDLPPIPVPSHKLTQAVLNLIVNAGEASDDGGAVTFAARTIDDGACVEMRVSDTGHGMTPQVRRQALDPFFTTKKRSFSTGLGLSLVHAVAHSAGGRLEIESEPNSGASIAMIFPTTHEPATAKSATAPSGIESSWRAVITVDDPRLASFALAVLTAAGGDVVRSHELNGVASPAIWVTDMRASRLVNAEAFLNADDRNRVIAIGEDSDQTWARLGALHVDRGEGAAALRRSILRAMGAQQGLNE